LKDAALDALAVAVERHFTARSGTRHVLSPRDFLLLKGWHAAGVPLTTILAGIDRAFEVEAAVASLAYCRRFVEAPLGPGEGRRAEPPATPAPAAGAALPAQLKALQAAVRAARAPAAFERAERLLAELIDFVAVAHEPNRAYLGQKLAALDELVDAAALDALPAQAAQAFAAEAQRAAERQAGKTPPAALQEAQRRYLVRRARDLFALPRVGGPTP
jgi:hypothetical protein